MPAPKGHAPYNVNGEGGRPKKYDEAFLNTAAQLLEKWIEEDENNIFIERFCWKNNISDSDIPRLCKEHERFGDAYNKLRIKQKTKLFEGGLDRSYAHPMCALILSHNHNVHLKTEQKLTGDAENPLSFLLGTADNQQSKELIACEHEEIYRIGSSSDERENQQPLLENQQSILDCGQTRQEDTLQTELCSETALG